MAWVQVALTLYVIAASVFIVSENRRPQSTFAWMFLFILLPVAGLVVYVLFGRERKAFDRRRRLLRQDMPGHLSDTLDFMANQHERAMGGANERVRKLATLIQSNAHSYVTTGNRVRLLQDAAETYPAIEAAIGAARSSIHLQYYSWASDAVGERLGAILKAKAAEGVEVRLLYDPIGSLRMLSWSYVRAMNEAGVEMVPFSRLWALHTVSYRNHRKIVVVDGRVAFAGGLNIGDEHVHPPRGYALWRDTHLRLEGHAALAMQGIFAVDWANAAGNRLLDARYFPVEEAAEPCPAAAPEPASFRDVPVQVGLSGPDSEWRAIQQLYFAMIANARRQVLLTSPYFVLDASITEALRSAALAGLDVRVMISAREPGWPVPNWAANTYAAEVAEAGVKVLLYQGGYLHAKTICVDGQVCTVGSANWDIRSFSINYELTAVLYHEGLAREVCRAFRRDEAHCTPFDHEAYRARPAALRWRDSAARLASPLL